MSHVTVRSPKNPSRPPRLENGDCLDQATFHKRYLAMPEGFRAELIEGVVYVPSPLKMSHGEHHGLIMGWLTNYWAATPGARFGDNPTLILGEHSEPQADAILMIDPACGGQAEISPEDYVVGPPELIVEVASSSEAYDLHQKRRDYERAGVLEYVIVLLRERAVRWLAWDQGAYRDWPADEDGVFRSRAFPGLWLNAPALLQLDGPGVLNTLQRGLSDAGHAEFVEQLAKRRR
jgi:Uma2 family endonuclease